MRLCGCVDVWLGGCEAVWRTEIRVRDQERHPWLTRGVACIIFMADPADSGQKEKCAYGQLVSQTSELLAQVGNLPPTLAPPHTNIREYLSPRNQ